MMSSTEESEFLCIYGPVTDVEAVFVTEEEGPPKQGVYYVESPLQIQFFAKKIAWAAVFKKLTILVTGESEWGIRFKEEAEICHLAAHLLLSEAADYGVGILKNARANQKPYLRGMDLKGAFKEIPAVVVGAGPSLEKNGHLLHSLQDKALILAGGSALNAIQVEPHFGASIDKEAPYNQFKMQPFSEIPFCYQSRMNSENFSLLHGERLLFPDGSSEAINWLQDEKPFDSGWTVGNFLTAIAVLLGCNPIIFIGMDLCYTNQKKYAEIDSPLPEGLIQIGDFLTQKDWLMAAKWTEHLAKQHPEIRFINATAGGMDLGIPRVSEIKLERKWDLKRMVFETLQKLPLISAANRWSEWTISLHRCQEVWENEVVYEKLLLPLWQVWGPIFERELENDPGPLSLSEKMRLNQTLFFQQVLKEHLHG